MDTPKRTPRLSGKKWNPIRPTPPVACRKLFSSNDHQDLEKVSSSTWSIEENKALVQFVLYHGPEDTWPSHSKCSKL